MSSEKAKESKNLRYVYTPEELLKLGNELADANRQINELEEHKKSVVAQLAGDIKAEKAIQNILTAKVGNGSEYKDVVCEVLFHVPKLGMKTLVRTDIEVSRNGMEREIVEEMTDKDWMLWNNTFRDLECDVQFHTPVAEEKTYFQRSTGLKFIEPMSDKDREKFEDECSEVKINFPKDGLMTLTHPSGVTIETRMNQAYMKRHLIQQELFPVENPAPSNSNLDEEEVVVDGAESDFEFEMEDLPL